MTGMRDQLVMKSRRLVETTRWNVTGCTTKKKTWTRHCFMHSFSFCFINMLTCSTICHSFLYQKCQFFTYLEYVCWLTLLKYSYGWRKRLCVQLKYVLAIFQSIFSDLLKLENPRCNQSVMPSVILVLFMPFVCCRKGMSGKRSCWRLESIKTKKRWQWDRKGWKSIPFPFKLYIHVKNVKARFMSALNLSIQNVGNFWLLWKPLVTVYYK